MSDIVVTLPDGSELEVEAGSTVEDVAYGIGPGLGEDTVGGIVDGDLAGREEPLEADCELVIITEDSEEYLRALRHSAAHVFAQALGRLHPGAKLAIGPPTEEGFYYDVAGVDEERPGVDDERSTGEHERGRDQRQPDPEEIPVGPRDRVDRPGQSLE